MRPEEKLLEAIWGKAPKEKCTICGKVVQNPVYINKKPCHPLCASSLYER